MKYWTEYEPPTAITVGKKLLYDDNIYTFDIETSSFLILDNNIINSVDYLKLTKEERARAIPYSTMYIWQFSVNEEVYFGRKWGELKDFLQKLNNDIETRKIIYIHNASFEFQFLKSHFNFKNVMARKSHKVIKAEFADYNAEIRCTYMMSNCALEYLPKLYNLTRKKKVGYLDYTKFRTSDTELSLDELLYSEHDCLVVYDYILHEKEQYQYCYNIPLTSTGHVRREFKVLVRSDLSYKKQVRKAVNQDPHVYNLLLSCFMGGYTHGNWTLIDDVHKEVDSVDFTSSYPYCLVAFKYPSTIFKPCKIKKREDLLSNLAYILVVKFSNIESKYFNTILSQSKCITCEGVDYDNGRILRADSVTVCLTDIDFNLICDWYEYDSIEIIESYFSAYKYLPIQYVDFILDKYVDKTKYKGIPEEIIKYTKSKNLFNALYGMAVTNNIRDKVLYDNEKGWEEIPLTNEEIEESLYDEYKNGFLSFAYGVWCTAYARNNLLRNVMKLDKYVIYCDTDSLKLLQGYDKTVIEKYNESVLKRLQYVAYERSIDYDKFSPKDRKGIPHPLGVFDFDGHYSEFITQGAKKYAYRQYESKYAFRKNYSFKAENELHITVSGVPKSGAKCLKNDINNFKDSLIFDYETTKKNLLLYTENQELVYLTDYQGHKTEIQDKSGCCILPTTYVLGKSEVYAHSMLDDSSQRAIYKE